MARWKSFATRYRYRVRKGVAMGIQKLILSIALTIVDCFTFFVRPKKDRILFVSLTQDHLTSDFKLIDKKLKEEGIYDLKYNLIVFEKNIWGDLKYFFNCLSQLVQYKQASLVIINDNNYVLSTHKPKNCEVLQIWHACGAIKKFGNEIDRKYTIQNYDYAICNAKAWKDIYARSFGMRPDQIYVTGMPRTDRLLAKKENRFLKKHPELKGKKLCLYAPTFRGNIIDGFKINHFDFKKVEAACSDWVILYKFHPLLGNVKVDSLRAINVNDQDLYELMDASDCIISDYSSVILDYSLLHKPIIEYISDVQEYENQIGLNVDIHEITDLVCTNEDEIITALQNLDSYDVQKNRAFQEKYMEYTDGKNTDRVISLIHNIFKKSQS